jgi:hypothetical protein
LVQFNVLAKSSAPSSIPLTGELEVVKEGEQLALLYPLETTQIDGKLKPKNRAAYTHKCAGMKARGTVTLGESFTIPIAD